MKKIINMLFVFIVALLFLSGCSNNQNNNNKYDENKRYYIEISNLDNFISMYESDILYMAVIGQTICGHCEDYKKIINKIAYEEDINIYWLEFDLLNVDDKNRFQALNERFNKFGTPLTIFIKNKEIVDEISGNVASQTVISKLSKWDLI